MKFKLIYTVIALYLVFIVNGSPIHDNLMKRDVVDLRNSGSKTTSITTSITSTVTSTQTHKPTLFPIPIPSSSPVAIYGGVGITPQNGIVAAFLIVLGIYLMVFGFRSFRITLGICGFLTFALITWVAMANNQPYQGYTNNDITLVAVPGGLGILGIIVYAIFWNISIYLVGAMGGFTLALYIMCWKVNLLIVSVVARAAFMISLSFFMSMLIFFVEKYVLLFTFSWVGAYCFMVGVELLGRTGYLAGIKTILDGNKYHRVVYTSSKQVLILMCFIPILFLLSFAWQFVYNLNLKFGVAYSPPTVKPMEEMAMEEKHLDEKSVEPKKAKDEGPGDPGPINLNEPFIEEKTESDEKH